MSRLAKATITLIDKIPARRRPPRRQSNATGAGGQADPTPQSTSETPAPAADHTPAPATTTPATGGADSGAGNSGRPPRRPTRFEPIETITLHFNPETLEFKVENKTETKKKRTNQRVQYTGESSTTLSFDCIFDSTRPGAPAVHPLPPNKAVAGPEELDVRAQTRVLSGLLNGLDPDKASEQLLFPKLVRFKWGSVKFTGYVSSFSETLEFFSPEGVPLRSKVSLTLTEQSHRYHVTGGRQKKAASADQTREGRARPERTPPTGDPAAPVEPPEDALDDLGATIDEAKAVAEQSGLDDLFELGDGLPLSYGKDFGVGLDLSFRQLADDLQIGADIDLDLDLGQLEAVLGDGAHRAARGVERQADRQRVQAGGSNRAPAPQKGAGSSWAPRGPRPGTEAARLAAEVFRQRLSEDTKPRVGGSFRAASPGLPDRPAVPPPVLGSPPLRRSTRPTDGPPWAADRPRWEGLPNDRPQAHDPRCTCRPCTSGDKS